jgi:hypothetical protein
MSKYDALTIHLSRQSNSYYPVNFKDIEKIVAAKLPASAYRYPAWWSNNPSNNVMTGAWLRAGWESSNIDIPGQKLVFRRKARGPETPPPQAAAASAASDGLRLTISGIPSAMMARLEAKAQLRGTSAEEYAREILAQHSILSVAERLSLADRIRGQGPKLGQIDVPGMIRADRDGEPRA